MDLSSFHVNSVDFCRMGPLWTGDGGGLIVWVRLGQGGGGLVMWARGCGPGK